MRSAVGIEGGMEGKEGGREGKRGREMGGRRLVIVIIIGLGWVTLIYNSDLWRVIAPCMCTREKEANGWINRDILTTHPYCRTK